MICAALAMTSHGALGQPAAPASAPPLTPAAHSILAVAQPAMQEILSRDGTARDRGQVLKQNLSRYFAAYPIELSGNEGQRIVGTVERMSHAFAEELYRAAEATAHARGAEAIAASDVTGAITAQLPSASTPYKTIAYFPAAGDRPGEPDAAGPRVELELADLAAFAGTGVAWNALGALVARELPQDPAALPLEPAAVQGLAEALSAYGLLLLRLGAFHAAAERAPSLQSRHLRAAGKTIETRAAGEPAPIVIPPHIEPPPPQGPLPFVDVTAEAGIDFRHVTSDWLSAFRRYGPPAPSFSGGGVAAEDVDGDGWPDLVLCGGEGCALYRNRRDGRFEEIGAAAGITVDGEARMPLLADFDNDGDRDLFITYARDPNRLFENLGPQADGTVRWRDLTAASGLGREGDISGPAVAFDADGDGLLDLYIGNFGDYLAGETPWATTDARNGMPNRFYRNQGGLRFADDSERAGAGNTGWSQALSHADLDLDGDQDLYLANDFGRNELLLNRGNGTFEAAGAATGSDDPFHGMNVSFADLNGDRRPDIFVTNIWHWQPARREVDEYNTLLSSLPPAAPEDGGAARPRYTRAAAPGQLAVDTGWSWAGLFFDADLDGDDDLFVTNGLTDYSTFVQYRPMPGDAAALYPINDGGEPNLYFRNDSGQPERWSASGAELAGRNSRGLALLDYDLDGDLDLAITTFHGFARLFRNDAPADAPAGSRHWLVVELVGDPQRGVPRDAIGAQLIATGAAGYSAWRTVTGGEGYLSESTLAIELGLGALTEVDLEIVWPGGERQRLAAVPADQRIRVQMEVDGYQPLTPSPRPGAR